jgi:hypothetical protein
MIDEIVVVLEDSRNPPRFRLAEHDSPPRIVTAAVVDVAAEEPIWSLVPLSFSTVLPFTIPEVTAEDVADLADQEPVDPIEDLPPSDPRHQEALASRARLEENTPALASLTYGVVPSGFRQASPQSGVSALVPGRLYHLMVIGPGGHGSLAFQVE